MKKKVVVIIILLTLYSLFISGVSADDSKQNEKSFRYLYPITVQSKEWFEYTVKEKVDMLRINETVLSDMTDCQLIYAVADYPYLCDIYVYGLTVAEGVEQLQEYCSALGELLKRPGYQETLIREGTKLINEFIAEDREDRTIIAYEMRDLIDALCSDSADMHYSKSTREILERTTPYASYVIYDEEHVGGEHFYWDNSLMNSYQISLIRQGTCHYNCHSYAWHDQSTSNIYWIPDPTAYTTSGYYTNPYSGGVSATIYTTGISTGDIIFYQAANTINMHSVIFTGNASSGVPIAEAPVISKWGKDGLFTHHLNEVPVKYDYSYISVWH